MTLGYFDNRPHDQRDTANRKAAFLDAARQCKLLGDAHALTMTPRTTVSYWRKTDPTFKATLCEIKRGAGMVEV